jgi:hypothetical protein
VTRRTSPRRRSLRSRCATTGSPPGSEVFRASTAGPSGAGQALGLTGTKASGMLRVWLVIRTRVGGARSTASNGVSACNDSGVEASACRPRADAQRPARPSVLGIASGARYGDAGSQPVSSSLRCAGRRSGGTDGGASSAVAPGVPRTASGHASASANRTPGVAQGGALRPPAPDSAPPRRDGVSPGQLAGPCPCGSGVKFRGCHGL